MICGKIIYSVEIHKEEDKSYRPTRYRRRHTHTRFITGETRLITLGIANLYYIIDWILNSHCSYILFVVDYVTWTGTKKPTLRRVRNYVFVACLVMSQGLHSVLDWTVCSGRKFSHKSLLKLHEGSFDHQLERRKNHIRIFTHDVERK